IREYYEYLLGTGLPMLKARNSIARYIAKVSYAMLKNKTTYIPLDFCKIEKIKYWVKNANSYIKSCNG
ncbi:MAG: hypothetical protein U9O65_07185, partial [Thermotogota bacterium]|nr:hypothetical protein [Thermotogota bacterium]